MTFLFALIGLVAIGLLLWRAFGPQLMGQEQEDEVDTAPVRRAAPPAPRGPDDDPEFLNDLDRRTKGPNGTDADDH